MAIRSAERCLRVSKRNSGVYRRRAFGVLLFASVLGLRCGETEVFLCCQFAISPFSTGRICARWSMTFPSPYPVRIAWPSSARRATANPRCLKYYISPRWQTTMRFSAARSTVLANGWPICPRSCPRRAASCPYTPSAHSARPSWKPRRARCIPCAPSFGCPSSCATPNAR